MTWTNTDCGLEWVEPIPVQFKQNDGGRSRYFKGTDAGDCVVRAVTIASGRDYKWVYDQLSAIQKKCDGGSARNGVRVQNPAFKDFMRSLGFRWRATMKVGQGCKVHLHGNELPAGRLVCQVSKHSVAVIDGVIHDTYDSSRGGKRCVYGYWELNQ